MNVHGRIACIVLAVGSQVLAQDLVEPPRSPDTMPAAAASEPTSQPAADANVPPTRALPSPFDSPPFPFSDYLGPTIGAPDATSDFLLMNVLKHGLFGNALEESRIKVYGWVDLSMNVSTSQHSNIPLVYNIAPNRPALDQAVLRVERVPDTVQKDHIDWGFRVTSFGGIDYRYTTAQGYFSDQLLRYNNYYGFDAPEMYALLYVPWVAEGMVIKVGRYISPPDIEAQFSPDNYLFTHSVMYSIDPYTFTGIQASIRLHPQWTVQFGVHSGADMAPWTNVAQPNGQFLVRWVSKDNQDSFYGGINSIGSGEVRNGHDNLQHLVGTWTHKFSDKIHTSTEVYWMWERNGLLGGTPNFGPVHSFGTGGGAGPVIPGLSNSVGVVNYLEIALSKKDCLSIRNDFLDDIQGQRTGFPTTYTSHAIGWSHAFTDSLSVRPELRYDHSYEAKAYDNGTRRDQFTFSIDMIFRF